MKIIVIGSEGNIGTKLTNHLRKCDHEVLRADLIQHHADDYVQTDVVSLLDLYDAAYKFKPDVIYHLAAMVSRVTCEEAPHLTVDTNLAGTNKDLLGFVPNITIEEGIDRELAKVKARLEIEVRTHEIY